jgi:hypothetical protein
MGKDPNAPKRNLSAYLLYSQDNRPRVVKANPNAKHTAIMGLVAKEWGKLSDAAKKPYEARSAKMKKAYQAKLEKYKKTADFKAYEANKKADNSTGGGLVKKICKQFNIKCKKRNPTKMVADPNKPTRPASAFFMFGNVHRPALMKKFSGIAQVGKELGRMWGVISDAEKSKFQKKADVAKAKHAVKVKKYETTANAKNYKAACVEFKKMKKAAK